MLLLRRNEFAAGFSVIYEALHGAERGGGRIYYSVAVSSDPTTRWH